MQNIDFLPEKIKQQRARRRRLIRQVHLLVVCMAGLAVLGYIRHERISKARAELALLEQRAANVRRQLAMKAELERQQSELLIKKRIDDQLGSRVNVLDILAELERTLPENITLSRLIIEPAEVTLPVTPLKAESVQRAPEVKPQHTVIKRVRVSLTGLAPTDVAVANFIGQLAASPIFEDVKMGYTKNVVFRKHVAREFQTSCYVVK